MLQHYPQPSPIILGANNFSLSLMPNLNLLQQVREKAMSPPILQKDFEFIFIESGLYIFPTDRVRNLMYAQEIISLIFKNINIVKLANDRAFYIPNIKLVNDSCNNLYEAFRIVQELGEHFIFTDLNSNDFIITNYGVFFIGTDHILKRIIVSGKTLYFTSPNLNPLIQDFQNVLNDKTAFFTDSQTHERFSPECLHCLKELEAQLEEVKKYENY